MISRCADISKFIPALQGMSLLLHNSGCCASHWAGPNGNEREHWQSLFGWAMPSLAISRYTSFGWVGHILWHRRQINNANAVNTLQCRIDENWFSRSTALDHEFLDDEPKQTNWRFGVHGFDNSKTNKRTQPIILTVSRSFNSASENCIDTTPG